MSCVKRIECQVIRETEQGREFKVFKYLSELPASEIVKKIEALNLGEIYEIVITSTDAEVLK